MPDANIRSNQEPNAYLINTPEIIFQKQIKWSIQWLDPPAFLLLHKTIRIFSDLKAVEYGQQYTLDDLDHHILPQDTESLLQLRVEARSFEVFYPQDQFSLDSTGDLVAEFDRK